MAGKLSRRERKRRNVSDSSSDSDSDTGSDSDINRSEPEVEEPTSIDANIDQLNTNAVSNDTTKKTLMDIEQKLPNMEELEAGINAGGSQSEMKEKNRQIDEAREKLLNEYVGKMVNNYGDDLDELRTKPDFKGQKSVGILAHLLKESGHVFDDSTLKAIVREE